jgi:hypothetical protein
VMTGHLLIVALGVHLSQSGSRGRRVRPCLLRVRWTSASETLMA